MFVVAEHFSFWNSGAKSRNFLCQQLWFFLKVSWWKQNIDLKETNVRAWHLCTCWCKDIKTLKLISYFWIQELKKVKLLSVFFSVHLQLAYLQSVTLFSSTFFLSFSFICCCCFFIEPKKSKRSILDWLGCNNNAVLKCVFWSLSLTTTKLSISSTADQECLELVVRVIMCTFALLCFYIVKFFPAALRVWEIKVMCLCRRLGLYWLVHMC